MPGAASAAIVHALNDASTAGFTQGSAPGETPRGWDFQVNTANVQVVQLGVNAATSDTTITLSLWDVGTQTLLAQTTADSSAGGWVFASLGSPVTLTAGNEYSVIGWADAETPWYLFNNAPPAVFNPTGTIQYLGSRFDNGVDANTFPVSTISSPAQYGVTDIGYQTSVPEPSSMVLAAFAALTAAGTALIRSRRGRTA